MAVAFISCGRGLYSLLIALDVLGYTFVRTHYVEWIDAREVLRDAGAAPRMVLILHIVATSWWLQVLGRAAMQRRLH